MGICVMQEWMPVAYCSRKLNKAQLNYTTMENKLLSLVMLLKEYRPMLLGVEIDVKIDQKNLTFAIMITQCALRCCNADFKAGDNHFDIVANAWEMLLQRLGGKPLISVQWLVTLRATKNTLTSIRGGVAVCWATWIKKRSTSCSPYPCP